MSQLNDEILRATGGPTVNEGLALWFSKLATEALGDAERRWLLTQAGAVAGTINDLWYAVLRAAGHTGSLNDMKLAYWASLPTGATIVPNVVGLTQVDAEAALVAEGLIKGTVTLTVDPVASQLPVAGAIVASGSAIDLTMTS